MNSDKLPESPEEQRIVRLSQQALNDSVTTLDERIQMRLRDVRRQAVQGLLKPHSFHPNQWFHPSRWVLPAGLIAGTAVVVLSVSLWISGSIPSPDPLGQPTSVALEKIDLEDMAILVEAEEPEFYQNLEFFQWLDEQDDVS